VQRPYGPANLREQMIAANFVVDMSRTPKFGIPLVHIWWYCCTMSGTYTVVVGVRGRLVVPVELRDRAGLTEGTTMVLLETPSGIVLMTREQLRDRVRDELSGLDLVGELLAERRASAATEDAA